MSPDVPKSTAGDNLQTNVLFNPVRGEPQQKYHHPFISLQLKANMHILGQKLRSAGVSVELLPAG